MHEQGTSKEEANEDSSQAPNTHFHHSFATLNNNKLAESNKFQFSLFARFSTQLRPFSRADFSMAAKTFTQCAWAQVGLSIDQFPLRRVSTPNEIPDFRFQLIFLFFAWNAPIRALLSASPNENAVFHLQMNFYFGLEVGHNGPLTRPKWDTRFCIQGKFLSWPRIWL